MSKQQSGKPRKYKPVRTNAESFVPVKATSDYRTGTYGGSSRTGPRGSKREKVYQSKMRDALTTLDRMLVDCDEMRAEIVRERDAVVARLNCE